MSSVVLEPVFFIPCRGVNRWFLSNDSSSVDGIDGMGTDGQFVGDEANNAMRYVAEADQFLSTDWPLVFIGPSGVGKTTLAVSVAGRVAEQSNPNGPRNVTFWSAVEFSRRYRSACETDSVADWRQLLAGSGILVIDGLEDLETHPAAQKELVHVLDLLQTKQIPVIFTVNQQFLRSDKLMPQLESRLMGGLSLQVNPPGLHARRLLVRSLVSESKLSLSDEAVEFIAGQLPVTAPRLKHFLNQLFLTLSSNSGKRKNDAHLNLVEVSEAVVTKHLNQFRSSAIKSHCDMIVRSVAAAFKLKPKDLKSGSRKQTIALARAISIYFQRTLLELSFTKIGANFGGRDHSTIVHSKNKIEKIVNSDCEENDELRRLIVDLNGQINDQIASVLPV